MTDITTEIRTELIALAGERGWGETRERWLERAARRAGITYRTAKAIFYNERYDPKISVVVRILHAVERRSGIKEEYARGDLARLDARIQELEQRLTQMDQNFHSDALAALGTDVDETR